MSLRVLGKPLGPEHARRGSTRREEWPPKRPRRNARTDSRRAQHDRQSARAIAPQCAAAGVRDRPGLATRPDDRLDAHPNALFIRQAGRTLSATDEVPFVGHDLPGHAKAELAPNHMSAQRIPFLPELYWQTFGTDSTGNKLPHERTLQLSEARNDAVGAE